MAEKQFKEWLVMNKYMAQLKLAVTLSLFHKQRPYQIQLNLRELSMVAIKSKESLVLKKFMELLLLEETVSVMDNKKKKLTTMMMNQALILLLTEVLLDYLSKILKTMKFKDYKRSQMMTKRNLMKLKKPKLKLNNSLKIKQKAKPKKENTLQKKWLTTRVITLM